MTLYVLGSLLAFGLSYAVTPLVRRLALRVNAIDTPGYRKIHSHVIPRLGGLGIYLGFVLPLCLIALIFPSDFSGFKSSLLISWPFLFGATLVFVLGVADDLYGLNAGEKFPIQIIAASLIYWGGFRMESFSVPLLGEVHLGVLSPFLTLLWTVGLCNAMNLIDGLDGLAAGISVIGALTLFVTGVISGNEGSALAALLLVGSTLGFLRYNFFPAKIFMGDSGSLFLGFTLAALSLESSHKSTLAGPLLIPIVALWIPIADTLFSMIRRCIKRRPLFSADQEHFHHKLILKGFNQPQAVMVLCGISAFLGLYAVLMTVTGPGLSLLALPVLGFGLIGSLRFLGYSELTEVRESLASKAAFLRAPRHKLLSLREFLAMLGQKKELDQVEEILDAAGSFLEVDQLSVRIFGRNGHSSELAAYEWKSPLSSGAPSLWSVTIPLEGMDHFFGSITLTKFQAGEGRFTADDLNLASAAGNRIGEWLVSLSKAESSSAVGRDDLLGISPPSAHPVTLLGDDFSLT